MSELDNYRPKRPGGYSAKNVIKPIIFRCMEAKAQTVTVMGDFNDWHPESHPMTQQFDGSWRAEIPMNHGHHHYLFCVDGQPTLDPNAQGLARNERGEKVCLVSVS